MLYIDIESRLIAMIFEWIRQKLRNSGVLKLRGAGSETKNRHLIVSKNFW